VPAAAGEASVDAGGGADVKAGVGATGWASKPAGTVPTDDSMTGAPANGSADDVEAAGCASQPGGVVPIDDAAIGAVTAGFAAAAGVVADFVVGDFCDGLTSVYLFVTTGTWRWTSFDAGRAPAAPSAAEEAAAELAPCLAGGGTGAGACSFGTFSNGNVAAGTISVGSGAL
jgi:hypothetical protein